MTSSTTDLIVIDDADDPRLACFRRNERGLTSRRQRRSDEGDGLFMAEGDLVVERALDAGCTAVVALVDAAKPPSITARLPGDVPIYAGGDRVRAMVTQLGMPQGIVALFARPPRATPEQLRRAATRVIAVEAVDNPINIGSIIRNAVALGWDGMLFDSTSADPALAAIAARVDGPRNRLSGRSMCSTSPTNCDCSPPTGSRSAR